MKKWITNNWPLKLVSVLFAVVVWIVIVNVDDPVGTVTISNIPVEIVNDDVFREQGKTYTVVGTGAPRTSVRVTERRKVTSSLTRNDFRAVADFSDIYQEGQVPITVTCSNSSVDVSEFVVVTPSLEIQVENLITVTQSVTVNTIGEPAEGYTIGDTQVTPSQITVTAPQSFAERIRQAVVNVDVGGASDEVTAQPSIQLLDAYGEVMSTVNLAEGDFSISSATADVRVEILSMRETPITVSVGGVNEVAEGYRYTGYTVEPDTVRLSGLRSALGQTSLEISNQMASVAGASEDVVLHIALADLLPSGVTLVEGEPEEVTVTLRVEPLEELQMAVPVSALTVEGLEEGLEYSFASTSFTLRVRGLAEDLDHLKEESLSGTIDLSGLSAGFHAVPVEIQLPDAEAFELVAEPMASVRLTEPEEESSSEEEAGSGGEESAQEETAPEETAE